LGPGQGNTGPIKGGSGSGSSGNVGVDEHQDTPFNEFSGCTPEKKTAIVRSWFDVIDFVKVAHSVDFSKKPGTLESRIFGDDVHTRPGAADFIHSELPRSQCVLRRLANLCSTEIYDNILNLYEDKVYGKIHIACQDVYQKNRAVQVTCKTELENGEIGGYAWSYSDKIDEQLIVMCDPFFRPGQELLLDLLKELRSHKSYQKDPHQLLGKTRMLLHEITHLAAMAESKSGK
jgi:hypothetical protein